MNEKRAERNRIARKLNEILGTEYKVVFDACESGLTDIYFREVLLKSVPNSEMRSDLNVNDYRADYRWRMDNGLF